MFSKKSHYELPTPFSHLCFFILKFLEFYFVITLILFFITMFIRIETFDLNLNELIKYFISQTVIFYWLAEIYLEQKNRKKDKSFFNLIGGFLLVLIGSTIIHTQGSLKLVNSFIGKQKNIVCTGKVILKEKKLRTKKPTKYYITLSSSTNEEQLKFPISKKQFEVYNKDENIEVSYTVGSLGVKYNPISKMRE